MTSWGPIDISQFDCDEIEDVYDEWDADFKNDLEGRYNKLIGFKKTLDESLDEDIMDTTEKTRDVLKCDTIEMIANEIYAKLTISFNNNRKRFGIHKGKPIVEPLRYYYNFKLADGGELTFVYKKTVIDLGNIDEGLKLPFEIHKFDVTKLRLMGFTNITDEDTNPYRKKFKRKKEKEEKRKKVREKIRKLDENLNERSKAIPS